MQIGALELRERANACHQNMGTRDRKNTANQARERANENKVLRNFSFFLFVLLTDGKLPYFLHIRELKSVQKLFKLCL